MSRTIRMTWILITLLAIAGTLQALVVPEKPENAIDKAFKHADLTIPAFYDEVDQLPPQAAGQAQDQLFRLGVDAKTARVDRRSGRFATLLPTEPLVPGIGNQLQWSDLRMARAPSRVEREKAVEDALRDYLELHRAELGIAPHELAPFRVVSHGEDLYQIHVGRAFDGIPVRGSSLTAVVGQGNLTLFGAHQWGDRGAPSNRAQLSSEAARAAAVDYLAPLKVTGEWGENELVYVPMARGQAVTGVGSGYNFRLVWAIKLKVDGDDSSWELLVDAHDGEILANEDQNHYAEIKGGVYPVTNDGVVPDGVEQAGWPMPFQDVSDSGGTQTTDTGGNAAVSGNITATFSGPFVNVNDNCGVDSLTQAGSIDWGTSAGTDCVTPGFGGAGNTHSSRTGFYELNKIQEMARGQLPTNTWLQAPLTANMNINSTCNAFWSGSVNFFRSGGSPFCSNTGEIAAVFDHEWGHGMDANDVVGGIAAPSGEGIADVYAALRLNTSCIGRNFRPGVVCGGYGDACLTCTGVRDIDYLQHASGLPHTYTWRNANCGGGVHCSGHVYSEAIWSLWKRKLQSAPYNLDNNTAHEIVNRLTYIAAGNTTTWFSGGPPNGGCAAGSGYLNYLAADDDNGNLLDGTPHMQAIYDAFNDQEIACQTPTVQDSGCAGVPNAVPNVTTTVGNNSVTLNWASVGADHYDIFRTEGVHQCDFGKVRLGETTGTTWTDTGLQNGRNYYYIVIPKGSQDACFGSSSLCDTAVPQCIADADCDDGLFCNGAESCVAGSCVAGTDPCPGQTCDETFASAAATAAASAQASASALSVAWATADAHAAASALSCAAASASASSVSVSWSAAQASAAAAASSSASADASASAAAQSCSGALAAANAWASACAVCQCASACANASASAFAAAAACASADASSSASAKSSAEAAASARSSAAALGIAFASADAWSAACAAASAEASASASALAIAYAAAQANADAAAAAVADAQAAACGTNCSTVGASAAATAQANAQANAFALAAAFASADAAASASATAAAAATANASAATAALTVATAAAEAEASASASATASAEASAGAASIAFALAQATAGATASCSSSCVFEACCKEDTQRMCSIGVPPDDVPPDQEPDQVPGEAP